jgi:hypothetical protein
MATKFSASGSGTTTIAEASSTDRTATLPDATGTIVFKDTTDVLTNKTLTSPTLTTPVINGATSASGNFDLSGSTGTFLTSTGANTISGVATMAATKALNLAAGTATAGQAPLYFNASGSLLTVAAAGANECDATSFYDTIDTTNGRRYRDAWSFFRLAANGTPFTSITDFFGATSAIPTVLNGVYEIEWHCYFAIATLSTQVVTWTIVNTQTVTNMVASWQAVTAIANMATAGNSTGAGVVTQTAASVALPVTGTMVIGNHYHIIRALIECATAGNVRLRCNTASTATVGALRDSYFKARRLPAGNVGTFAA